MKQAVQYGYAAEWQVENRYYSMGFDSVILKRVLSR